MRRNVDGDGVDEVVIPAGNDGIRDLMRAHLYRIGDHQHNQRAWRAVSAAEPGSTWPVTFRADVAIKNRSIDFITPTHPLVAAIVAETGDADRPVTALLVRDSRLAPGTYAFFVYLLQIQGARPGFELACAAVGVDGHVDQRVSEELMSALADAAPWTESSRFPSDHAVEAAEDAADAWAAAFAITRQTKLTRANDQILDRRSASLRESTERIVSRQTELLGEARAKNQLSMIRLREGERSSESPCRPDHETHGG